MTEDDIRRAAADLAGGPVRDLIPARPGGNNRIFKVVTQDGAAHALKIYPQQAEDPRDRLGVEFRALSFLFRKGIGRVPRAVAMDRPRHCALYEWIDGAPPPRCDASIDALARFLADLKELAADPEARDLGPASAACPSAAVLSRQVEERRRKLDAACADSGLAALLTGEFDPLATRLLDRARKGFARGGLDFEAALPPARQVLSPSDFGFHNALAVPGGGLRFIDFEYFGWDDPVKAAADVALHAGMDLDPVQARRFLEDAPMTAGEAAKVILDGVKADRWRILVGEDAQVTDRLVRETPEEAYEPAFFQKMASAAGWQLNGIAGNRSE